MKKQVFICNCKSGEKISKNKIEKWKDTFQANNINYILIEDLCGTAVKDPEKLEEIKKHENSILFGCNSRAMEHVLFKAGIRMCCTNVEFKNMETECTCIVSEMNIQSEESGTIEYNDNWKSWYPIIDYSKCSSCQKCLNFCLFGVYKTDDYGNVLVDQPSNCKDLCPACARTCPEQAIIFPKHNESPIDGGEGEMEVQSAKDVIEQIQNNNDVYKILEERRKKSGISLLKDQEKIAEEERACCVNNEPIKDEVVKAEESEKKSDGGCGCGC